MLSTKVKEEAIRLIQDSPDNATWDDLMQKITATINKVQHCQTSE